MRMWEQQKMLPKMNIKLKIVFLDLEIVCNSHTFYENCLDLEWFNLLIVVGFSKSSTLQILWGSGMTYNVDFWLEFQNLPHILKDLLQIVRIWNSSTFFHRFWMDLECLNCWFWLEFQNLPHLFYMVFSFLKIVWIWNDLTHWFWLEFQNLPQGECGFQME